MPDATPPDVLRAPLGTAGELPDVWTRFRAGEMVPCPVDAGALALAVDGAAGAYRFVCVQCGLASLWFEASPNGMHLRGSSQHDVPDGGSPED